MSGKIYMGGDKGSYEMKAKLKKFFEQEGVEFVDLGVFNGDETEYKDIEREVAEKVHEEDAMGVLVFGKKS